MGLDVGRGVAVKRTSFGSREAWGRAETHTRPQDRQDAACLPQLPPARDGGSDFHSGNTVSASEESRVGKVSGTE